jgi:8-oxo-dGTP pyrophosphatase MutT (NUDIX family)
MRQVAGGVIVNAAGMICVVAQPHGSWSLPKGHVEPGESYEEAAVREIEEETGIPRAHLALVRPLKPYVRNRIAIDGGEVPNSARELHFFLFTTDWSGALTPTDPENPEALWLSLQDAANRLSHPRDREFLLACAPLIDALRKGE